MKELFTGTIFAVIFMFFKKNKLLLKWVQLIYSNCLYLIFRIGKLCFAWCLIPIDVEIVDQSFSLVAMRQHCRICLNQQLFIRFHFSVTYTLNSWLKLNITVIIHLTLYHICLFFLALVYWVDTNCFLWMV